MEEEERQREDYDMTVEEREGGREEEREGQEEMQREGEDQDEG